jgi:hypothetical protein
MTNSDTARIDLVDKRLDAAIFDRKTETNAIRAEVKLTTR